MPESILITEVIGTLRGIPGQENGILIGESDKARVYIGGADRTLGEDLERSVNHRPSTPTRSKISHRHARQQYPSSRHGLFDEIRNPIDR